MIEFEVLDRFLLSFYCSDLVFQFSYTILHNINYAKLQQYVRAGPCRRLNRLEFQSYKY